MDLLVCDRAGRAAVKCRPSSSGVVIRLVLVSTFALLAAILAPMDGAGSPPIGAVRHANPHLGEPCRKVYRYDVTFVTDTEGGARAVFAFAGGATMGSLPLSAADGGLIAGHDAYVADVRQGSYELSDARSGQLVCRLNPTFHFYCPATDALDLLCITWVERREPPPSQRIESRPQIEGFPTTQQALASSGLILAMDTEPRHEDRRRARHVVVLDDDAGQRLDVRPERGDESAGLSASSGGGALVHRVQLGLVRLDPTRLLTGQSSLRLATRGEHGCADDGPPAHRDDRPRLQPRGDVHADLFDHQAQVSSHDCMPGLVVSHSAKLERAELGRQLTSALAEVAHQEGSCPQPGSLITSARR